jgi:hypothetical protein
MASEPTLIITYTNWRGETAERRIIPIKFHVAETSWHPGPQWLLKALDVDRDLERDFAVSGIKGFPHPEALPRDAVAGLLDAAMRDRLQLAKLGGA